MTDLSILLVFYFLMIILAIRNELVYHHRTVLISWIYKDNNWKSNKQYLEKFAHNRMVFMLTKWRFKDFYPEVDL